MKKYSNVYDYLADEVEKANAQGSEFMKYRVFGKIEMAETLKAITSSEYIVLMDALKIV